MKDRVLVVENELALRKSYVRWLKVEDLVVIEADLESLRAIEDTFKQSREDIVCVISDGNLNRWFTGADVVKAIRGIDENVRIVAVTSDDVLAGEMLQAGADMWLPKAFALDEFLGAVKGE